MIVFLLKSTACLAIFLAFYKLVLEKESIHQFKRFFLLGALIASFLIPNIVFTEYVEMAQNTIAQDSPITGEFPEVDTDHLVAEEPSFDWAVLLWSVYILGVIAFGFRFMRHLAQIWSRIRRNPKFKENFVTKVLLRQSLPPHTFFNYIFLNQQQFVEKNIPQEVLLHEETHAKQRHSLDILFIELAQVILWFNPIVYLFKSSIKLNHEFLADRAVIDKNNDHSQYQNTILSYLSHDSFNKYQSTGIANALNYSSIKKRFTVMKTNTSKKSFVFRSLLLLPLMALLLFGFSTKNKVPVDSNPENKMKSEPATFEIQVAHSGEGLLLKCTEGCNWKELNFSIKPNQIKNIDKSGLTNAQTSSAFLISLQKKKNILYLKGLKGTAWKDLNFTLSENSSQYFNQLGMWFSKNENQQQSATREEMKEYNALAKKYNDMDRNHMIIKKKEVMRLKMIYDKMSKKQRADAEPFPNFPPPPPAPDAPEPPKNVSDTKYATNQIESIIDTQDPYDEVGGNIPISSPPAPPAPQSPLEHIKEMADKGATFMFNGKEITAKKAIEVIQNNHKINIDSRDYNGKKPIVKLSTEPIEIEN